MFDRVTRIVLVGVELFLGVTAVIGGVSVVPTLPREWLAGTPFPDFTIPALALTLVGSGAFVAAVLLLLRQETGIVISLLAGLGIAIFEAVETMVVGLDVWLRALGLSSAIDTSRLTASTGDTATLLGIPVPLWLQPFYFVVGVVIIALSLRLWVHRERRPQWAQMAGI